jgi:hypothetical protein
MERLAGQPELPSIKPLNFGVEPAMFRLFQLIQLLPPLGFSGVIGPKLIWRLFKNVASATFTTFPFDPLSRGRREGLDYCKWRVPVSPLICIHSSLVVPGSAHTNS